MATENHLLHSLPVETKIAAVKEMLKQDMECMKRLQEKYAGPENTRQRLFAIGAQDGIEQALWNIELYFPTPQKQQEDETHS